MEKFTANYCYSNSNFVITGLPTRKVLNQHTNLLNIVQNLICRGTPTIASEFLRKEFRLQRNYIEHLEEVKFFSRENLDWEKSIKGDDINADYPASQFYDDLKSILNRAGFIRNLIRAECPIADIIPEMSQEFSKQQVDFYIPLMKTVIEVDGEGHKQQTELDQRRDKALKKTELRLSGFRRRQSGSGSMSNLKMNSGKFTKSTSIRLPSTRRLWRKTGMNSPHSKV